MARSLPIDLVSGDINAHIVNKKKWDECLDVSKSLYKTLILDNTRDFVVWDTHLMSVLHRTQRYSEATEDDDMELEVRWKALLQTFMAMWDDPNVSDNRM